MVIGSHPENFLVWFKFRHATHCLGSRQFSTPPYFFPGEFIHSQQHQLGWGILWSTRVAPCRTPFHIANPCHHPILSSSPCNHFHHLINRLFYLYGDHIEFIRFKEYYGMPRGALAQYLCALFGQKENFNVYFSGKRRSSLYPNTAQRSFFPLQSFSRKT